MFQEFLILGAGRTGSTCLVEMLDSHEEIMCLPEIFDDNFAKNRETWEKRFEDVKISDNSIANYYCLREHAKNNNKVFGFKFLYQNEKSTDISDYNYKELLYKNPKIRKIIVYRNLLETYISDKTGELTDKWSYENTSDVKIEFNYNEYVYYCIKRLQYYYNLNLTLSKSGQLPINLSYSNIVNTSSIKSIVKILKLQPHTIKTKTKKQNSHFIHERVSNYEHLVETCTKNEDDFYKEYINRDL